MPNLPYSEKQARFQARLKAWQRSMAREAEAIRRRREECASERTALAGSTDRQRLLAKRRRRQEARA